MVFNRGEEPKKRGGFKILTFFRILLSLTMMLVLFLAVIQALKYFAGTANTPILTNPKELLISLITSDESAGMIRSLLNFTPPSNLSELKGALRDPNNLLKNLPKSQNGHAEFPTPNPNPGVEILKFAVVADSHNDNEDLRKGIAQAKEMGAKLVIGLGDYTDVGTLDDLQRSKDVFASADLPYYSTAGDHDLWDSRNVGRDPVFFYNQVFGSPYQSFGDSGVRFLILYNSDNYKGVDQVEMSWLSDELDKVASEHPKAVFAFMQEPLSHPTSDHFMGKVTLKLVDQAQTIAKMLAEAKVSGVFAGDTHFFTKYVDPKTHLKMVTVGAITRSRNLQPPRLVMVDVFEDGSYNIQDVELK